MASPSMASERCSSRGGARLRSSESSNASAAMGARIARVELHVVNEPQHGDVTAFFVQLFDPPELFPAFAAMAPCSLSSREAPLL